MFDRVEEDTVERRECHNLEIVLENVEGKKNFDIIRIMRFLKIHEIIIDLETHHHRS